MVHFIIAKRCDYIGTFVIEANQEMRETIENGLTEKIDENPFITREYAPLARKILYLSAITWSILFLIYGIFGCLLILGPIVLFLYFLIASFLYFRYKNGTVE